MNVNTTGFVCWTYRYAALDKSINIDKGTPQMYVVFMYPKLSLNALWNIWKWQSYRKTKNTCRKWIQKQIQIGKYVFLVLEFIWKRCFFQNRRYFHTVWEPLLGRKKCSGMETITGVKFMHFLIEIYQNWNFLIGALRENSKIWPKNCPILIKI